MGYFPSSARAGCVRAPMREAAMKHAISVVCLATLVAAISGAAALSGPMARAFTPEEHLMYVQGQRGQDWRALSPQQRCERQQQMQRVWNSMSPADLQNLRQRLDARWDALPAAQKQRLEQRIQQRIANRQERRATGPAPGQHPCAGGGGAPL
jgi:Spy/CpxP family protein refolding chaperone